jgi:hypothetical protein
MSEKYVLDLKDLVEFSYNLIYVSDLLKISDLLDSSFNKNYYQYSKIIYNNICPNNFINKKIILNNDIESTNPFNRILFVVKDKEALLKNISDKGYNITQGSKQ